MQPSNTRLRTCIFHLCMMLSLILGVLPQLEIASAQPQSAPRITDPRRIPQAANITQPQACTPMPECFEAQYYLVYGQSKTAASPMSAASRTVVLNWANYPGTYGPIGAYKVYRRVSPSLPAMNVLIADTGILASESAFTSALATPPDLLTTLRVAMNSTGLYTDTLTTTQLYNTFLNLNTSGSAESKLKARIAVQKFPALAEAVGLGYRDFMTTNLASTLIYTVKRKNTDNTETVVGTVTVAPDGSTTTLPTPVSLREAGVYGGNTLVGVINSTRPVTVPERYDASIMQNEIGNDGKVYLIWNKGTSTTINRMVTGYNVYRKLPTGIFWSKLNTELVSTSTSQSIASSTATFTTTVGLYKSYYEEPYYFVDDTSGFSSTYRSWSYRVCAVDIAGTEGTCSTSVTAIKRDLVPPSPVENLTATTIYPNPPTSAPGKVRIRWTHTDYDRLVPNTGNLPAFFITRAITTGVKLANWTVVASNIAATSALSSTYVFTDSPPLNAPYWYRIQVRDNAGNWSALSEPVKGSVYDRIPPTKPAIEATSQKKPCFDRLMTRLPVPADVRQVVLSRRLSQSGEWRIVRRLRPNTNRGSPRGVDIVDKYITPLPNTPVYYKIEFLDAYNNMSLPATLCVRGNSPNDLLPPRFTLSINNTDNGGPRMVTVNFGTTTDIYSRTVVVARPNPSTPASVTSTAVAGNASTFQFQIDTGESLRVGAIASALTATTSLTSTLNSRWIRNVNNFLNLDTIPSSTKFLDTPRNMANLGTFTVAWASANSESCRDTFSPPRKACAMISSRNYVSSEKPPMVALFRRLKPSGNMLATDVPWLQVSTITNWVLKSGQFVVEDTTIFDPTRNYEYMAVAHSSTSYEVIGYFAPVTLTGTKPGTPFVNIGKPANTAAIPQQLPAGCRVTGLGPTAETVAITDTNKTSIPPYFFDENDELANTFDLQQNFTFVADYVIKSKLPICVIPNPATNNSGLYLIGTLRAGTRTVSTNAVIYNATLAAPSRLVSTKFLVKYPPMAPVSIVNPVDPDGLIVRIRDFAYEVNAAGVMTSTTALTVTLPAHIRMAVDTVDPLYSQNRAGTVVLHTDTLDGNYDTDTFVEDVRSNTGFAAVATSTKPGAVIVDEYAPWFYRASGITSLNADLSGISYETVQAFSRTTYAYGSAQFTNFIPDSNSGFVGTYSTTAGGRNYIFNSSDTVINMKGLAANLVRNSGVNYTTSYPAGVQIAALSAAFKVAGSVIYSGELISPTVRMKYIAADSDTSFAKVISTKPVFIRGNYLPIESGFSYTPTFPTRIVELNNDGILNLDQAGISTEVVTTTDTIKWPGFEMLPDSSTVDMTLYLAPATPVGMSTTYASIPEPAESAWEQIDLGYADESDLDPGLNFNGQNSVNYACYGTGVFDARMDTYLRMGGFSEHLILQGLGASVKNNTTGYDESLLKFSAIYADNIIVDPSDVESELNLPYPSDVTLPLDAKVFDSNGCPVGGDISGGGSGLGINHKYWNFAQQAMSYGYASGPIGRYAKQYVISRGQLPNATNLTAARTALPPMILQISGNIQPMAARTSSNAQANLAAVSEWLPNGEFGNITLGSAVEVFNSGMPFTLNDVILNRYNATLLDVRSKPSTAGFNPKVGGLPSKLLDGNSLLTEDSLAACLAASAEPLGCGFQILDGSNSLKYFGEPEPCTTNCVSPSGTTMMPLELLTKRTNNGDTPSGDGSIGSAGDGTEEGDTLWNPVLVQLMWDLGSPALDIPFPLVFIANKSGGVFAGMFKSQSILPGAAEVFKSDVSVVVNGRLDSAIFTTDIGIFFGYAASQAALRALSTHRPNDDNTGFKAHEPFSEVKDDVKKWSKTFGYGDYDNTNDKDDPVDMLEDLWGGHTTNSLNYTWGNARTGTTYTSLNDYQNVFNFLEPKLKDSGVTESYNDATQGITALKQGTVLANACTTMKNGQGAVQFQVVGSDVNLQQIAFGSYVDIKNTASSSSCDSSGSSLLTIDRVSVKITGDGEITIIGDHLKTTILEKNIEFDVQLVIGTSAGNQRVEGGIKLYTLEVSAVEFSNIGVVFGIGQYNSQRIGYFGFMGTGKFKGYTVTASFLFGMLSPSSAVLQAQFGPLMSKLSADKGATSVFSGVYISVGIEIPIYTDGCMREVKANGELRGWYFKQISPPSSSPISWGGYISAGVYGEAACLVSARGQLSLEIYESTGILHFDGQAWLAGGVGDCEPSTWNSWGGRWWGDSWCAQAGAMVQVNYAENSGWNVDYDLSVESPW